jgi:predicted RNA methylase
VSRAKAVEERVPLDAYLTPQPLADAICHSLRGMNPGEIIEPSAGKGAFVRAARATWPAAHITAVDIDPRCAAPCRAAGASLFVEADWRQFARLLASQQDESRRPRRLIIGNPTYREAQEHIEAALELMLDGDVLAYLLRVNFLGAKERVAFWRRGELADLRTVCPRPSFGLNKKGKKGSDGTEYAVFRWVRGHRGLARIGRPLVWTPERARRTA